MGRFREAAILTLMLAIAATVSQPLQTRPEQASIDAGVIHHSLDSNVQQNRSLTRAELAFILVKSFDLEERRSTHIRLAKPTNTVKDVPPTHWAYGDIQSVVQTGVMTTYPGQHFRPDQTVTRAEGFAAIAQAYGMTTPSAPEAQAILQRFPDAEDIPDWAKPSLAALLSKGWINIREDQSIDPDAPFTRRDMAHTLSVYLSQRLFRQRSHTSLGEISISDTGIFSHKSLLSPQPPLQDRRLMLSSVLVRMPFSCKRC